jgi:hypothetical protein
MQAATRPVCGIQWPTRLCNLHPPGYTVQERTKRIPRKTVDRAIHVWTDFRGPRFQQPKSTETCHMKGLVVQLVVERLTSSKPTAFEHATESKRKRKAHFKVFAGSAQLFPNTMQLD